MFYSTGGHTPIHSAWNSGLPSGKSKLMLSSSFVHEVLRGAWKILKACARQQKHMKTRLKDLKFVTMREWSLGKVQGRLGPCKSIKDLPEVLRVEKGGHVLSLITHTPVLKNPPHSSHEPVRPSWWEKSHDTFLDFTRSLWTRWANGLHGGSGLDRPLEHGLQALAVPPCTWIATKRRMRATRFLYGS